MMPLFRSRLLAVLGSALLATILVSSSTALAQTTEPKPADAANPAARPNDPAREDKRKLDQFAEAARVLGGPAANPECVWLGRRVVGLMWRDDLDTAFRHLDLYDRFGCPGGHIQATFRCVVRQGNFDLKAGDTLNERVHACWVNPNMQPATAAATTPATPQARAPGTPPPN
jgi:hypothetical protein